MIFSFYNICKYLALKRKSGKEPEVFGLDIGCKLEVMAPKITSLLSKYKRIDILINNAGVSYRGEVS